MNTQCSLLIVEDDENDVFFLTDAIRRSEVTIPYDVVMDGQSAIDFLSAVYGAGAAGATADGHKPCIVLLDLNLPHKSGFEVLRWIRQESPCNLVAVIVLTASGADVDMRRAYQLGANAYVIKPNDTTRLRELCKLIKGFWLDWSRFPSKLTSQSTV